MAVVSGEGREALSALASASWFSLHVMLPHPHPTNPQKLKDEIADVFAQIDCFETMEER